VDDEIDIESNVGDGKENWKIEKFIFSNNLLSFEGFW
jgi:hypothetical protein